MNQERLEREVAQAREDLQVIARELELLIQEREANRPHKLGPLAEGHPLTSYDDEGKNRTCEACHQPFFNGQYVTLVTLGPADDPEEREKAREGRPYNAVAIPIHWACATGEE